MSNVDKLIAELKRLKELEPRYIGKDVREDIEFPYDEFNQLRNKYYPTDVRPKLIRIIEVMKCCLEKYEKSVLEIKGEIWHLGDAADEALQQAEKIAGNL